MFDGFPERLHKLRKAKGWTQQDLGKLVGLHPQHLGRYERGVLHPTPAALERLAQALEVSADYLIMGEPQSPSGGYKPQDSLLFHQFEEAETLPEEDKMVIRKLIDAFLTKKKVQALAAS